MKKLSIHNLTISVNNEKINIIYLENKLEKYILYFPINTNSFDNMFYKLEFNENIQITPKKKMNDLKLTIDYNSSTKLYRLLFNNNQVYFIKSTKNITANHPDLKLMLDNGKLYQDNQANQTKPIVSSVNNIVNEILSKNKRNIPDESEIKNIDVNINNDNEFNVTKINNLQQPPTNEKHEVVETTIKENKLCKDDKKQELEKEVFNLENILIDFNKLFQFIKKDNTIIEEKNNNEQVTISNVKNAIKPVNQEIKINKKEYNIFNLKINYQNILYKISAVKLEQSPELNMLNLYKQNIPESNYITKNNLSFILENNNSSYLVLFMNQKVLINKIGNSIVFTNLVNRNSQILKNKDNFKIGYDDFLVYNDCTLIIPVTNQKIFDNNYGTSYNLYIPRN